MIYLSTQGVGCRSDDLQTGAGISGNEIIRNEQIIALQAGTGPISIRQGQAGGAGIIQNAIASEGGASGGVT